MQGDVMSEAVKQIPGLVVLVVFAWQVLKFLGREAEYYRRAIDGVLARILGKLDVLDERTEACLKGGRDRAGT